MINLNEYVEFDCSFNSTNHFRFYSFNFIVIHNLFEKWKKIGLVAELVCLSLGEKNMWNEQIKKWTNETVPQSAVIDWRPGNDIHFHGKTLISRLNICEYVIFSVGIECLSNGCTCTTYNMPHFTTHNFKYENQAKKQIYIQNVNKEQVELHRYKFIYLFDYSKLKFIN